MSVEQIKALAKRFYEGAVNEGDFDLIDELFAENFVEHEAFPGLSAGREGVRQFFSMMHSAFEGFRMDVEDMIAEGDRVVARIMITGTHSGEFMDIAGTGATINVRAIDIIRFADGKAVEHWGVTDRLSMMEQLAARNMS